MSSAGRLTHRTIAALAPVAGTQYVRWDRTLPGFGVRVSPAGAKTFFCKYRLKSGRVRWGTIGRVGAVTLEKARRRAQAMIGEAAEGDDPLKVADAARGALTLSTVADRFLEHIEAHKKPPTVRLYRLAINAQIRPRLGTIAIADVTDDDVFKLHHRLKATPVLANRTVAVLSSLMSWCTKMRGGRPNPCLGIKKYPEQKRKRYLNHDEYARLGAALRASSLSPGIRTAIELLLLTGARPAEIASLQWAHVDLARGAFDLPDSKTGAKTIHLPPAAVRLLKKWPRFARSPYVFPGTGRRMKSVHVHGTTLAHAWASLRTVAGLEDVRLYDAARHSYASVAISDHDLTLAQIGGQLGHSQPATTARYAHLHDTAARMNAVAVGATIEKALKRKAR